jgi:hypothetical protein
MGGPQQILLISSRSIDKYGRHRQFLFMIGQFLIIFYSETALPSEPNLGRVSDYLAQRFQGRRCLEIDHSETRIVCGGHVC